MNPFRLATALSLSLLVTSFVAASCRAQRDSTAFKTAEISAFAGYENLNANLGPGRDSGIAAGLDYTRFFHFPVAPSFEIRANVADGMAVNEKSYVFGLRLEATTFGRFQPYVNGLAGLGRVHYNEDFYGPEHIRGDASSVYQLNGGFNYSISRDWQVKAELQAQRWRPDTDIHYLFPIFVGVTYRVPFKRLNSTRTLH